MKELITGVVQETLGSLKEAGALRLEAVPAFSVDPAKQAAHGDYACNVALLLAKGEGRPPRAIAETIVKGLVDPEGVVAKVEIAGPGFLNFTLADGAVTRILRTVHRLGAAWGRAEIRLGKRALLEYVSANPTGPIHIGHARGTFVGDALARLLDAAGYDVTKEFYVNDYGRQVEILGRTVLKRYRQLFGIEVELAEGGVPRRVRDRDRARAEGGGRGPLAAGRRGGSATARGRVCDRGEPRRDPRDVEARQRLARRLFFGSVIARGRQRSGDRGRVPRARRDLRSRSGS